MWATKEDLYTSFGQEFVDKLCIRRNWDAELEDYVASEDQESKDKVLNNALNMAKTVLIQRFRCSFRFTTELDTYNFPALLIWHQKTTIELLKIGGDCTLCKCEGLDEWMKCNTLCTEDGSFCLPKKGSILSASKAKWPCECQDDGCCRCR